MIEKFSRILIEFFYLEQWLNNLNKIIQILNFRILNYMHIIIYINYIDI